MTTVAPTFANAPVHLSPNQRAWRRFWKNRAAVVSAIFLVMFVAWNWRRADSQSGNPSFDLMFAGAMAVSLLTGFHMFTHDFSPLLLAMFLVVAHLHTRGTIALRTTLWTTLALFWMPPIYFAFVSWHTLYLMCPVLLVFALSTLRLARRMQMQGEPLQAS